MNDWLAHIPQRLQASAYRAGDELAWPREQAMQIAEVLKSRHFVVIGVDIWLPTIPGPTIPTPSVYDWSLDVDDRSPTHATRAVEFIRDFQWADDDTDHQGLEPYFNLTVMKLDT